jgi:hypothetical protein
VYHRDVAEAGEQRGWAEPVREAAAGEQRAGMSWSVVPLAAEQEEAYRALVAAAPGSPLSHTLVWRDVLADLELGEPRYWLALRAGEPRAALPAFVRRSEEGAVLNSLPFVQSTGGVITAANASAAERAEAVAALLEAMLAFCQREGVHVACLINSPLRDDRAAFPRPPDFAMRRTTNYLDLAAFAPRPSVEWTVRKVERLGPRHRVAETAAEVRAVYDVYAAHMAALGVTPHPLRLFEGLHARATTDAFPRFSWVEVEGVPVSVTVLLVHREVADYHSVGSTEAGRRLQASSWLCQQEIGWARERGVRWWNWGVSPTAAVHDFKKRWGGEDRWYEVSGWCLGDVGAWRRRSPPELAAAFPSYFVLPYEWLDPKRGES